ncbi:hypothetical protein [Exiguobacterium sp. s150]|uniref:hypothetical protein n=1 Tax=Exiguobacterium sp. s150 TaxID=2751221 RepID=UPI001BEB22E4|nr:hypothetical protein [Exiguobacterium sp. s150]
MQKMYTIKNIQTSICIEELFGMPAVGKSSWVEANRTESHYIKVNEMLPINPLKRNFIKIKKIFSYTILHPRTLFYDSWLILNSRQKTLKDLLIVWSNWFFVLSLYSSCSNGKYTYIFDQGMFQALWSIRLSAKEEIDFKKFIKDKYLPGKIFFLDEDESILRQRESTRAKNIRLNYCIKSDIQLGRKTLNDVMEVIEQKYKLVE